ncbi:16S rRNA (cytosine(1402)-N(4))-methyltransferase RsmH [candidate division WWE3 bacterium]|jgi:16S rRNA (cytosine1402-N4)-methyltransferase|nr:16S rRNA (cytosine(1402)-N(4))-methyltransferase RsmH [candidate division WWE3 bacterium]MBT7349442.1 16S rRNA (cytosine(1402)-N(4))-methyltransferase RsmH [candidate division WWE3 bacterium]
MKYHEPVLLLESLEALQVKEGGKYIDCTLGDGGHTLEILKLGGTVLGLDVAQGSLDRATKRITEAGFADRFTAAQGNFSNIENLAKQNGFEQVDGVFYDLGYSSTQLEESEVGLSFKEDQPLDMRLDKALGVTAADLVNALPETELIHMIRTFGEERMAKRFAQAIVKSRDLKKIESTKDLVDIIVDSAPPGYEKGRLHPATRVFQALRIAVNSELESLTLSLPVAARILLPGGRMGVITFHSLEDRIVKQFGSGVQPIKNVSGKPIGPSEKEIRDNPRARSAKLRVYEKNETA